MNTNTAPADIHNLSLKALTEYLEDCDEHAIEPDVGSAFANAFRAGAALSTAAQPPACDTDTLLRVIQRLNQNPYNLTKSECIYEVEVMRDDALAAAPKEANEPVQPERVPLTDRQISDAYFEALGAQHLREQDRKMVTRFARAIEAAHGIQPAHKEQP